jgi:hypothetical protein
MDITKNKAYTTKAKNVSSRNMHEYVTRLQPFENHTGSCFGQWRSRRDVVGFSGSRDFDISSELGYAVYSYGSHFPIYFYSVEADRWFGNADKYSRTTTNHQSLTRPCDSRDITWMGTGNLKYLVTHGYVAYVANRMNLKGEQ